MACFRGCNHPTVDRHIFSINRRWLGSCCTVKLNQYVMWINLASLSIKLMHWSHICKWRDFQKLSHTDAGNDFPNSKLANKSRSHHPITSCRGAWLWHSWHWTKSWRQGGVGKACSVGPIWFFNSEDKYQKQMTEQIYIYIYFNNSEWTLTIPSEQIYIYIYNYVYMYV